MKRIVILLALMALFASMLSVQAAEPYVYDEADILSSVEEEVLSAEAQRISDLYDFGVYIAVVEDYYTYSYEDVYSAAEIYYEQYSLGHGEDANGILLLLSMVDRDFALYTYGSHGLYAFSDAGLRAMTEYFLDDFRYDDWCAGFQDYLERSEICLEAAEQGEPYGKGNLPMDSGERFAAILLRVGIILGIPLVIAFIVIAILKGKMKSVARKAEASAYVSGGLVLTQRQDRYTHTTVSRIRIKSSSSSGGGLSSHSSGGGRGVSGKF